MSVTKSAILQFGSRNCNCDKDKPFRAHFKIVIVETTPQVTVGAEIEYTVKYKICQYIANDFRIHKLKMYSKI